MHPRRVPTLFVSDSPAQSWSFALRKLALAFALGVAWFAVAAPPTPTGGKPNNAAFANELKALNVPALRRAIADLRETFGEKYPDGPNFLQRLDQLEKSLAQANLLPDEFRHHLEELKALRQKALLSNPLLDFDKMLVVRRGADELGLPANWQGNSSLHPTGYDNEIAVLSPIGPGASLKTLYRPDGSKFVGDVDLHFDASRLLFSSIGTNGRWQVFEIGADGSHLRQVTPGDQPDVDNYDACYLPDGRIIFSSTAAFTGVPCVDGRDHVANLFLLEKDRRKIRQLCFDQDHDWSPVVMNDGRVLYQRWEYADIPHSQSRLLFQMHPDGTGQSEFYGSHSYWPNALFYPRPIPGHPTKVAAIVTGHHGVRRMGELVVFDPAHGRQEASGALQRIPGYGKKIEPIIRDELVNDSWPKFLHPWPLNENYFLVSAKPTAQSLWGIYLVDTFDNMLLLAETPGSVLFEPVPLRKRSAPPSIPDTVDPARKDALVYLADIYQGDGLKGLPRGTVKQLRIFSYIWAYRDVGGLLGTVGLDGPWDVRRILGTVPVSADGSAYFRVPANTPISVQPLDAEGKAVQLMRSWFTAMPGENISCVGCHERQNSAPAFESVNAFAGRAPSEIKPWHGSARGFSYEREVQPVLDRLCVRCHDGQTSRQGQLSMDLRGGERVKDFRMITPGHAGKHGGKFSAGYANLHRFVRRPGIESDYHLLTPLEFHADTTELVQLLKKNHYGVELNSEDWDRLITWIDLNAPFHGSWHEEITDPGTQRQRRLESRLLYAGLDDDPEAVVAGIPANAPVESRGPVTRLDPLSVRGTSGERDGERGHQLKGTSSPRPSHPLSEREGEDKLPSVAGWPFDAVEAVRRQNAAGSSVRRKIDLGGAVTMDLALIPAGRFVMGSTDGFSDEQPESSVQVRRSFWMGCAEISNEQFAQFDPTHDSHVESKTAYQFGIHGFPVNEPAQPVVRVSWEQAMAFCDWLSRKTGFRCTLPTEAQWEYACRAGTDTPFSFGNSDADFSKFANLADAKLSEFASDPYTVCTPLKNPSPYEDYIPKETRFNDGGLITMPVGHYQPNAWGLHDMHGNVWEWTRSSHRPYPWSENDGRNQPDPGAKKVVRGGSWRDRPQHARSSNRLAYPGWQRIYNVGFRIVAEIPDSAGVRASK